MKIIGIIPARMASSRFPGKPLVKIGGIPMVGHVYFRSKMSKVLDDVYVATCDKEIAYYIESVGGKAIMTSNTHERASDRAAEAMLEIEDKIGDKAGIVVMIQGDEPMLFPEMVDEAIKPMMEDNSIHVVNLMAPMKSREEHNDPNEVKVVVDLNNFGIYFSREPIPSWKKSTKAVPMYKQVCIIPFRRDYLVKFNALTPTPLEIIESIDMLRILEHGGKVKMVLTNSDIYSVDTKEDLMKVEELMKTDRFVSGYVK